MFIKIKDAYKILNDEKKRAEYDNTIGLPTQVTLKLDECLFVFMIRLIFHIVINQANTDSLVLAEAKIVFVYKGLEEPLTRCAAQGQKIIF